MSTSTIPNNFFKNLQDFESQHGFTGDDDFNDLTKKHNQLNIEDDNQPYKEIQNTEKNKKKLNKILLTRNRMLEVNIQRNEAKNKIIYSMFSFIILLIFIIVVIHYNIKN